MLTLQLAIAWSLLTKQLPVSNKQDMRHVQAAARVLAAYPPRGVIRLLPSEATWGDKPIIERLIAEEYILDTIHFFDGDRVECARTLALGKCSTEHLSVRL